MDILTGILFVVGLVLLISGAEFLVRGASKLAVTIGITPLVVGLTVVAFGTSSPELAVTIQSSYQGQADIAMGNVVGSNIANILLIIGIGAAITPLIVSQQLVRLEVPLMIIISVLTYLMGVDGKISRIDGIILFAGALIYITFTVRQSLKANNQVVEEEYAQEFDQEKPSGALSTLIQIGLIILGLFMLVLGSDWLIDGAVELARFFGLSELVIALTIIAVGTSLPEVATVTVASMRGERDIAVGNAIGSNIFNILVVLGLCSIVAPNGVNVSAIAIAFDLPVMIAVAIACLPIFFTNYRIARWEGVVFLGYYAVYIAYLILNTTGNAAADVISRIMLIFVIPITVLTIIVLVIRAIRANNHSLPEKILPVEQE